MKKKEVRAAVLEIAAELISSTNYQEMVDTYHFKMKNEDVVSISGKTEEGLKIKLSEEGKLKVSFDKDKILSMSVGKAAFKGLSEVISERKNEVSLQDLPEVENDIPVDDREYDMEDYEADEEDYER